VTPWNSNIKIVLYVLVVLCGSVYSTIAISLKIYHSLTNILLYCFILFKPCYNWLWTMATEPGQPTFVAAKNGCQLMINSQRFSCPA